MEHHDTLNLSLVGYGPEWENTEANLSRLEEISDALFSSADIPSPDILVFPEAFATGFSMSGDITQDYGSSGIVAWMKRMAARYGCAVAGSVYVTYSGPERYNRFCFATPSGEVFSYDKRHLYFGSESESCRKGSARGTILWKGWKIMPGVCFDLRFPCWSRNTPADPYDLYLNVANWPASRRKAADVLLKARAIENSVYAAMCNRSGSDPLITYDGHSMIVNYRGRDRGTEKTVLGTPVVSAALGKEELMRYRRSFPVLYQAD